MSRRLNLAVAASLVLHAAVLVLLPMFDARPPPKPPVQMTARLVEQPRPTQAPAPQPPPPAAKPEPKPVQKPVQKPAETPRRIEPPRPVTQTPPVIAVQQPAPQPSPAPSVPPQPAPRAEPPVAAAPAPVAPSQSTQPSSASSAASVTSTASVASDATTIAQYRVQIIELAGRFKRYPRIAQDNNWTGTAEVRLAVGADGSITALSVRKASGHAVLDNESLNMIRLAFGKLPVPESLRGKPFTIDVPVIFSLKDG